MEYTWSLANGADVADIVNLAQKHFETEIDELFVPEPITMNRNVSHAVINQFYLPGTELVTVCRDENKKLIAYTWASGNDRACWSDDLMVCVRIAHVDLELSPRLRVRLVKEMLEQWERFAKIGRAHV